MGAPPPFPAPSPKRLFHFSACGLGLKAPLLKTIPPETREQAGAPLDPGAGGGGVGGVAVCFILTSSLSGAKASGKSDKNDAAENKMF